MFLDMKYHHYCFSWVKPKIFLEHINIYACSTIQIFKFLGFFTSLPILPWFFHEISPVFHHFSRIFPVFSHIFPMFSHLKRWKSTGVNGSARLGTHRRLEEIHHGSIHPGFAADCFKGGHLGISHGREIHRKKEIVCIYYVYIYMCKSMYSVFI